MTRGLSISSRIAAAVLGGYAFTFTLTSALALWLPLAPAEAVSTATLLSFAFYVGAIVWVFAVSTHVRAWLAILVPTALFIVAILAAGGSIP